MATSLGTKILSGLNLSFLLYLHTYTCKYVPTCLLIHVSGEISPTPRLEGNNKIGQWYNHSAIPEAVLRIEYM